MDDQDLIAKVREGNLSAFRFLVEKHKRLVWHLVFRMVNQAEDAEDLTQEVFLRVFKDIRKFRGDAKLSTWIGAIAYNVGVDYLRKHKKNKIYPTDNLEYFFKGKTAEDTSDGQTNRDMLKKIVHQLIDQMPVHYRTVITMYHLQGFSYNEITDMTGMPEGTVKSYLNRSRSMLREKILQVIPDIHPVLFD